MSVSLLDIGQLFAGLSLIAIGGANALIPEMHRQIVEVQGWMSGEEFTALFALAQAAPGPNVLVVSLLGWRLAGLAGALMATAAMVLPSSLLAYGVARVWQRFRQSRASRVIQAGFAPVTVGLVLASGYVLSRAADHSWVAYAITAACALLSLKKGVHPLWLLAGAALLGAAGLV